MKRCTIATGHEEVTNAARVILEEGGNAFDAAVAAAFASSIAEPTLTSLGGGGFLNARTREGEEVLVDFFTDTPGYGVPDEREVDFQGVTVHFPGADQVFHVGRGSAAVPGVLKGLAHIAERFGRMPLRRLVEPAVEIGARGVPLTELQRSFVQLLWPILTLTEESRAIYEPLPDAGQQLKLEEAAGFLKELADGGVESFYEGEIAQQIDRDMREGGGLLSAEDLRRYKVIEREPLAYRYRGRRVLLNPPPSGGGARIARYLESLGSHDAGGKDRAFVKNLAEAFFSVEREVAGEFTGESSPSFQRGTTHLTVADDEGNVAAMTTSNGEGCAYVVPGTGVMLNNMLGEDDLHPGGFERYPPGRRVSSMMCPTIVTDGSRAPILALGSGGSQRIRTAVTQVLARVIDRGADLQAAVSSPRVHFDGEMLQVEPGFADEVQKALRGNFVDVNFWDISNLYFGGVHAVAPGYAAAGDPRRGGTSVTFQR